MTPAEILRARFRRRVDELAPELRPRAYAAYDMIRKALSEREWEAAIANGTADQLVDALLGDEELDPAFRSLRAYLDTATADAARLEAGNLPSRFRTAFNAFDQHVTAAVQAVSGRAIQTMKAEIRDTVRRHIADGMAAGKNPRVVARGLRQVIGLAPNQARAVANFEAQLRAGDRMALQRQLAKNHLTNAKGEVLVRRGHAGGQGLSSRLLGTLGRKLGKEPLTDAEINAAVDAYRKRMLAWNVETNARTMALNANRVAQRTAWSDAIEKGVVDGTRLRRAWITVGDSRVREEHAELARENTSVPYDEPYSNGDMYPGENDHNCRCIERYFLAREGE